LNGAGHGSDPRRVLRIVDREVFGPVSMARLADAMQATAWADEDMARSGRSLAVPDLMEGAAAVQMRLRPHRHRSQAGRRDAARQR
jgi:hypothetical protein